MSDPGVAMTVLCQFTSTSRECDENGCRATVTCVSPVDRESQGSLNVTSSADSPWNVVVARTPCHT